MIKSVIGHENVYMDNWGEENFFSITSDLDVCKCRSLKSEMKIISDI